MSPSTPTTGLRSAVRCQTWDMTGASGPLVLELTCTLAAPPERVFHALTHPEELVKWWGPAGFTTPESEMDPRVGGSYRLGMQPPDGELFHLAGEYLEVAPPTRLAYSFRWEEPDPDDRETVVELTLEALEDRTQLSLWHGAFATEARLALHQSGWADSLQRLSDLLEADG
jgi:uncharacterized protein YndB with AHSA1/START domain